MTAFVELIVQKFTEAAPVESTFSNFVAGLLENTANRIARVDVIDKPAFENETA